MAKKKRDSMKLTKEQEELNETLKKTEKQMIIITFTMMIIWLAIVIITVITQP